MGVLKERNAGAVSSEQSFFPRVEAMVRARAAGQHGSRAISASFHQRSLALVSEQYDMLDIRFIRYNSAHPGARRDLFPYFRPTRTSPVFNFKSTMSQVTREMVEALNLPKTYWIPNVCDYYRFVLTRPEMDGILCSPMTPVEMRQLAQALDKGPLTREEEEYMIWLSSLVHAPVLT